MIDVRELGLGSYILYLNDVYIVDGIIYEENSPLEKYRIEFKTIDGKVRNAKMINWINPIPLTPEILEKCGFKKDSLGWNLNEFKLYQSAPDRKILPCWGENIISEVPVNLHRLQNLYFWLTGEELNVIL